MARRAPATLTATPGEAGAGSRPFGAGAVWGKGPVSELKVRSFNSDTGCGGARVVSASAPVSSSTQYDL